MAIFKKFDELDAISKNNSPSRFCLIYGPDFWINSNNINILCNNFISKNPNIEIMRFNEDDINNDFAKFESCIRGASLFGGSNLAILKLYNDANSSKIISLLNDYDTNINAFAGGVYIIGNGLNNKSKIVQAFEKSKNAWSLRLFPPNRLDLMRIIQKKAIDEEVSIDKNAIELLLNNNSNESGLLLSQVENLALYVGKSGVIDDEAVLALNIDSKEGVLEETINFAFLGQTKNSIKSAFLAFRGNINPIQALNSILRRIESLNSMVFEFSNGKSTDEIVKDRRYNIFWKEQDNFKKQILLWRPQYLQNILSFAIKADQMCKSRGSLQIEIIERLLIRISETANKLSKNR